MKGLYVCGRCVAEPDRRFLLGTTTMAGVCVRCGGQAQLLLDVKVNDPRLALRGISPEFCTSSSISPYPLYVWDVNGYYRALGVLSDATIGQLRQAYQALDGQDDERLTYIMTQLLDPTTRAVYDSCQPGELFFDQHLREVATRRAVTSAPLDDTVPVDLTDALNTALCVLDTPVGRDHYGWGFYLWQSCCTESDRLSVWRAALTSACWEHKLVVKLGVGYSSGSDPWSVVDVGSTTVVFLNERVQPTASLACDAVRQLVNTTLSGVN